MLDTTIVAETFLKPVALTDGERIELSLLLEAKIESIRENDVHLSDPYWIEREAELVALNAKLGFVEVEPDWSAVNAGLKAHLESKEA